MAKKIQEMYRDYIKLGTIYEGLMDKLMESDDVELETLVDQAHEAYWSARELLIKTLMVYTKQSRQTVNAMICSEKFVALMNSRIVG